MLAILSGPQCVDNIGQWLIYATFDGAYIKKPPRELW